MNWSYNEDRKSIRLETLPKRHKKITGHRFSSVLGLNKYQTDFGAWCEITELVRLPYEDNKFTIAGKTIEKKQIDYVRDKFPNIMSCEEYYGNSFDEYRYSNYKDLGRIFDGVRDFVSVKEDGKTITMVGECKTSSKPQDWDNNNAPLDYLCQGMLYAYLDNLDRILYVISYLQPMDYNHPSKYIVSDDNTKLVVKKLKDCFIELPTKEYVDINGAITYCEDWWNKYVLTGVSPEFDEVKDKEYLDIIRKSKPANDNSLLDMTMEAIRLAKQIKEKEEKYGINTDKKDLKLLEDAIKTTMINDDIDCAGAYTLKRATKVSFNKDLLEKEDKNTYNKYCEEVTTYTLSKKLK